MSLEEVRDGAKPTALPRCPPARNLIQQLPGAVQLRPPTRHRIALADFCASYERHRDRPSMGFENWHGRQPGQAAIQNRLYPASRPPRTSYSHRCPVLTLLMQRQANTSLCPRLTLQKCFVEIDTQSASIDVNGKRRRSAQQRCVLEETKAMLRYSAIGLLRKYGSEHVQDFGISRLSSGRPNHLRRRA